MTFQSPCKIKKKSVFESVLFSSSDLVLSNKCKIKNIFWGVPPNKYIIYFIYVLKNVKLYKNYLKFNFQEAPEEFSRNHFETKTE